MTDEGTPAPGPGGTDASASNRTTVDTFAVDVPSGAPVQECPDCGRPFATEDYLSLHRGLVHPDSLDDADQQAFEEASEAEAAAIRRFRLKALGVVVLVYFVLLMVYAVV